MPENRLELLDQSLARRIIESSPVEQRRVAVAVARFAIEHTSLEDPMVARGLDVLHAASIGDADLRREIMSRVEALDEIQWDLQDAVDEGRASEAEQLAAFERARAANSVYYALSLDPLEAALESTYEANAATGQLDRLREVALQNLGAAQS